MRNGIITVLLGCNTFDEVVYGCLHSGQFGSFGARYLTVNIQRSTIKLLAPLTRGPKLFAIGLQAVFNVVLNPLALTGDRIIFFPNFCIVSSSCEIKIFSRP